MLTPPRPKPLSTEAIVDKAYSEASDAWSFGVLLWEMVTGRVPWEEEEALQVAMRVGKEGHTLPVPPGCDEVLAELMVSCWEQDPARRYTAGNPRLLLVWHRQPRSHSLTSI